MKSSFLSKLAQRSSEPAISWLMRLTLDQPKLISLAAGFTDNESLPVSQTARLVHEILGSKKASRTPLQYGSTAGHPDLRRLTAHDLALLDGHSDPRIYSPDRVLITNGSQQLLYIVSESLCDPGDIVLVEDPSYFVFFGIAQSHGLQCRGISMKDDGLDLEHLEETLAFLKRKKQLHQVKLLYLVSYFQNPSGATTSLEKKQRALEILRRYERDAGHPIFLLEDAAYRELRFYGPDVPSALAIEKASDRVIYAGTYSKPFATGIRVGFGRQKRFNEFLSAAFNGQVQQRSVTWIFFVWVRVVSQKQLGNFLAAVFNGQEQRSGLLPILNIWIRFVVQKQLGRAFAFQV